MRARAQARAMEQPAPQLAWEPSRVENVAFAVKIKIEFGSIF
jgi:hypothetical protein